MKRSFLILISFLLPLLVLSQNCVPDPMYQDSTVGVFPMPASDVNPDGGITEPACLGQAYEFVFTVIIQDSIAVPFGTDTLLVALSSASITNISGLPNGLSYACEPGSCTIAANESGCLVINGTPDDTPGEYPLIIFAKMVTSLGTLDISFPGSFFPGEYVLTLEDENSANCGGTASNDDKQKITEIEIYPIPARELINLNIQSHFGDLVELSIMNIEGKIIWRAKEILSSNAITVDVSNFQAGTYILHAQTSSDLLVEKFVINR